MEGTTEPIIAIVGHPIAGNPSQFAIERALHEMELEWRVLSFDVDDPDIEAALNGFNVLGIQGVLIDPSVSRAAAVWYSGQQDSDDSDDSGDSDAPESIDCLYRDEEGILRGSCEFGNWLRERGSNDGPSTESVPEASPDESAPASPDEEAEREASEPVVEPADSKPTEDWIWLSDEQDEPPICAVPQCEYVAPPPDPRRVAAANFILLSDFCELESEDWPEDDGSTIVIDLSEGHPERNRLRELGYDVVDDVQRRGGTLVRCLQRWTGQQPPADVVRDAIEEYLGV